MGLGLRIKEFRKKNNLTQHSLAEIMEVGQAAISAYEKDINNPSLESIQLLSDAFNELDIHWLITGRLISNTIPTDILQDRLLEYQKNIQVYQKVIEMLYDKFKDEKELFNK